MRIFFVYAILCSVLALSLHAETLRCPYRVISDGIAYERTLSLNDAAILPGLRQEMGATHQPWSYTHRGVTYAELEVQGNQALVTLPLTNLSPALTASIQSPGGAGCTVVPDVLLPTVRRQVRAARIVNGQPDFDHADLSRAIINPHAWQVAWLPPFLDRVFAWLVPRVAFALGAFPDVELLDTFTRTESPATGWAELHTPATGSFDAIGGTQCGCSTAGCNGYYTGRTGPADVDVTMLMPDVGAGSLLALATRAKEPGSNTWDGYQVETSAFDLIRIRRTDNGANTTLGADVAQTVTNGDSIGLRAVGSTLSGYYKVGAGAWSNLLDRTDSTYGAAGFGGIIYGGTSSRCDDFSMSAVVTAKRPRRPLFLQ